MMDQKAPVPERGDAPKCVLLVYQKMWGWLYTGLLPTMRERFGTRFIIISAEENRARLERELCGPEDRVVDLMSLAAPDMTGPVEEAAVLREAAQVEKDFGVNYLRDLAQQLRKVSANYFTHAPAGIHAFNKVEPWPVIARKFNALFRHADALIREEGVDLVISRPDLGQDTLAMVHVARARGIPVTFGKGVRYKDYVTWACGPYAEADLIASVYGGIGEVDPTPLDEVLPPGGSDQRWEEAKARYSSRKLLRQLLVESWNHTAFTFIDLKDGYWPGQRRLSYASFLRQHFNAWRVSRWIDGVGESSIKKISSKPYLLFLLPQEPEFAVQSLCREFPHTFTLVQQLAMSLPADHTLVIKEHALLQGRRMDFYKDALRLPNVILAHRLLSGIDLARNASAIATMSGTSGLEATLLGKQVVLFGKHIEYGFLPNMHRVSDFDPLPEVLRDALRQRDQREVDEVRKAGTRYRAAVAATSFSASGTPPMHGTRQSATEEEIEEALGLLLKNVSFQRSQMGARQAAAS